MNRIPGIRLAALTLVAAFCGIAWADKAPAPLHRALPKATFSSREDYYPPPAKRSGLEGIVSVALSIDGKGRVVNPSILYSDSPVFSEGVLRLLNTAHFAVPADWQETGQNNTRYVLSIRFELAPCGHLPHFELADDTIDVCGSPISGATSHRVIGGLPSSQ